MKRYSLSRGMMRSAACSLFFSFIFSCMDADSFDVPKAMCAEPKLSPNMEMKDFQSLASASPSIFMENKIIEAYVISSDRTGNFYKRLHAVSKDGKYGISLSVDRNNLHTFFEPGRKIYIAPKGLLLSKTNDQIQLGAPDGSSGAMIPAAAVDKFIMRSCERRAEDSLIRRMSIRQAVASAAYLNTLIEIDSVQFSAQNAGKPWYEASAYVNYSTPLVQDKTDETLALRISQFADFARGIVPKGVGRIRGVLQKFGSVFQLLIRDTTDVVIYDRSLILGLSQQDIVGEKRSVKQIRESFASSTNGAPIALTSSSFLEGVVTLSPNNEDNTGSILNVYMQDETGGILLHLSAPSPLLEGYRIRVNLKNASLGKYNGLLQISHISSANNIRLIGIENASPAPIPATLQEVESGKYESQLVRIDNVWFAHAPSFFSAPNYLADGRTQVAVHTNLKARFAKALVPEGSGSFVGIVSFYNKPQLLVRDIKTFSEWSSTGARRNARILQSLSISIDSIRRRVNLTSAKKLTVADDLSVRGIVTSDRAAANIQEQNAFLQDETGGIALRFTKPHSFDAGDEIDISLLGSAVEYYKGLLQIIVDPAKATRIAKGALPTPIPVEIADIVSGAYQGMLVGIDSAQFAQSGTFVERRNLKLENCQGDSLSVFIRSESTFGAETIPQGSGTIVAIASVFNELPNLYLRNKNDIDFTAARLQNCSSVSSTMEHLIITEVADPENGTGGRFIEIYNASRTDANLAGWKIIRYDNGSVSKNRIALNDFVLKPDSFYIVANNKKTSTNTYWFDSAFSTTAHQYDAKVAMTGNDALELENAAGKTVDAFGEKGVNGTGMPWEYTDGRAYRKREISRPNPVFDINEWTIIKEGQKAPLDFSPKKR